MICRAMVQELNGRAQPARERDHDVLVVVAEALLLRAFDIEHAKHALAGADRDRELAVRAWQTGQGNLGVHAGPDAGDLPLSDRMHGIRSDVECGL